MFLNLPQEKISYLLLSFTISRMMYLRLQWRKFCGRKCVCLQQESQESCRENSWYLPGSLWTCLCSSKKSLFSQGFPHILFHWFILTSTLTRISWQLVTGVPGSGLRTSRRVPSCGPAPTLRTLLTDVGVLPDPQYSSLLGRTECWMPGTSSTSRSHLSCLSRSWDWYSYWTSTHSTIFWKYFGFFIGW